MTLTEFFKGRAVVIGVLLILGLAFLGYKTYSQLYSPIRANGTIVPDDAKNPENTIPPVFEWKFELAKTFNPDGNPQTHVYLVATYPNGKVENKLIATTDGGCGILPDPEKDSAPNTDNIQCYYAGLGYQFKITKGEYSYLVLQQEFEEGTAEYTPPDQEYIKVAEFPLH